MNNIIIAIPIESRAVQVQKLMHHLITQKCCVITLYPHILYIVKL